jgi:hypothetical protein
MGIEVWTELLVFICVVWWGQVVSRHGGVD